MKTELNLGFEPVQIDPEDRRKLIAYLKRRLTEPDADVRSARKWLVILGDEQGIRETFATTDPLIARNDLIMSQNPVTVELLAPYLFEDEPLRNEWAGDVRVISNSHNIASNILPEVIAWCPDFNSEVINWAHAYRTAAMVGFGENFELMRTTLRQWWKDNEEHFKTRNYKAVRPPKLAIPSPEELQPPMRKALVPAADAGLAAASVQVSPSTPVKAGPVAVVTPAEESSNWNVLWIFGPVLVLLALGVFESVRRRKGGMRGGNSGNLTLTSAVSGRDRSAGGDGL